MYHVDCPNEPEGAGGPTDCEGDGEHAPSDHANGVDKFQRHECEQAERCDGDEVGDQACAEQEEEQHNKVPRGGEAFEIIVVGFHVAVAEAIERRDHDETCRRNFPARWHQTKMIDHESGNDGVGEVVDHQIQDGAVKAGGVAGDIYFACQRPVEPIDDEGSPQP